MITHQPYPKHSSTTRSQGAIPGVRLPGTSAQVSDGAEGQSEAPGDLGRGGPEAGHPGQSQPQRQFGGAGHWSRLPDPGTNRIFRLYRRAESHGTFVSGFCTEDRVR
jgi:hypothetical protein